jgi:regulator of sigma E protease
MNTIFGMILVLGVMILIHEWGHFIIARLFKVRVDVFSIGFGPRLFGWKRGATDWRVSALPLGGYVRMAGQDLSEVDSAADATGPTGAPDELMSKPRWQRALISFAGPAVNLIFPVVLLTGLFVAVGLPHSAFLDGHVQVVGLPQNAAATGNPLQVGDKIVSINGIANPTWEQALTAVKLAEPGGIVKLEVENNGTTRRAEMKIKSNAISDHVLGYMPPAPVLDEVAPGSPAEHAGLRENDVIAGINGETIRFWDQFVDAVRGSEGKLLKLDIERKGQTLHVDVTPKMGPTPNGENVYQIGVGLHDDTAYRRVGFGEGVHEAWSKTTEGVTETIGVVGKLVSGRVSVRQLQGAVGISRAAGEAVRRGPLAVISLMVLISVNLGILNLLPIPILDGGNILLLAIEGALRRDLSMAFKERFVQVGLVFLLVLFAIVMYNDVLRLLPFHS